MEQNPFDVMMAVFSQEMEDRIYERLRKRIDTTDKNDQELQEKQDEYLSVDELSDLTGLKKATIYAKRSRRELPAYKFGRELRFKRSEVDAWINTKQLTCLQDREGGA